LNLKRSFRYFLAASLVLVSMMAVAGIGWLSSARSHLGARELRQGLERLVDRSETLAAAAPDFDDRSLVRDVEMRYGTIEHYRFDDRADEASCEPLELLPSRVAEIRPLLELDFSGPDSQMEVGPQGRARQERGRLIVEGSGEVVLTSVFDLEVPVAEVGEIGIRLRQAVGDRLLIGWSSKADTEFAWPYDELGIVAIEIDTVPGEDFQLYRLDLSKILPTRFGRHETLQKMYLILPGEGEDRVEIESLHLMPRGLRYEESPCGEVYEAVGGLLRKALYLRGGHRLRFQTILPSKEPVLSFGVGRVDPSEPLDFKIVAETGSQTEALFAATVSGAERWRDYEIGLSDFAGRSLELRFEVAGPRSNVGLWSHPIVYGRIEEPVRVIVLLEDTLRADHTSVYGHHRETTPVLRELAQRGVVFENAYSQAPKTRASCPSLLTSLYPSATGVWNHIHQLGDRYLTLAEVLRGMGFATAMYTQNFNASPYSGLHQGFDHVVDREAGQRAPGLYGPQLYDWLQKHRDRSLFLYLHLIDPHSPYDPPPPDDLYYRRLEKQGAPVAEDRRYLDPEWVETPTAEGRKALYDGEIRYNDRWLGKFFETLEEKGLDENLLFVFLSDHGEFFGEHGLWEHRWPGYRPVIRVPLIMSWEGKLAAGKRLSPPVQLVDVMPTLLELLGVEPTSLPLQGDSLVPLFREGEHPAFSDRVAISEEMGAIEPGDPRAWGSIFFRDWHLLTSRGFFGSEMRADLDLDEFLYTRFFNLTDDPEEKSFRNVYYYDLLLKRDLNRLLRRFQAANARLRRALEGERGEIAYDPEVQERLKALGYID